MTEKQRRYEEDFKRQTVRYIFGTVPVTPRSMSRFVEIESHSACTPP